MNWFFYQHRPAAAKVNRQVKKGVSWFLVPGSWFHGVLVLRPSRIPGSDSLTTDYCLLHTALSLLPQASGLGKSSTFTSTSTITITFKE